MTANSRWLLLLILLACIGCRTPMFVDPGSGQIAPEGTFEFRPGFSSVQFDNDQNTGTETRNYGAEGVIGGGKVPLVDIPFDGTIRFEYADHANSEIEDWVYFSWQVRFPLASMVNFGLRSTINYRENSLDWNVFDLGLQGSIPMADYARLNLTGRFIPSERKDSEDNETISNLMAVSGGISVGPDLEEWFVTPVVSYLYDPEEDYSRWAWGIFFSVIGN